MSELLKALSKDEKEDLVLFPETHTKKAKLLDVEIELRPLPISVSKKLSAKITPLGARFDSVGKTGDAGNADLDLTTIDTLLDCVMILHTFYKLPSTLTKEKLEEEALPEEILGFLNAQMELNRDNNFLLQSLRNILRIVDLSSELNNLPPKLPSMLPTVSSGESASDSSPTSIPADS